jgi:signal transduction histidine kinase
MDLDLAAAAGPAETALPSLGPDAAWGGNPVLGRLLRPSRRLRRFDRKRPWLLDAAIVLAVLGLSLADLIAASGTQATPGTLGARVHVPAAAYYVLSAALIAPLWWRRRAPATAAFVILAVGFVPTVLGLGSLAAFFATLISLFNLALHGSLRLFAWVTALAAAENVVEAFTQVPDGTRLASLLYLLATVATTAAVGLTMRIRRMYLTALEDRARRLEIERDQRVRLTAAAERTRVAREMHDIVGHSLSVMVTLADGAATLATRDNERSAQTLLMLGETGRQAMGELRRVLTVLHEGEDEADRELSPQPGIGDLDLLLSRVRTAGLAVTYRTAGELAVLSNGLQLTVYRIVQEALTNTLKHAGTAAATEVTVSAEAGAVRVRIADTGKPPGAPAPSVEDAEPGHGLIGIRQRAALYDGTVAIGPREDRPGWVVDVRLDATIDPARRATEIDLR